MSASRSRSHAHVDAEAPALKSALDERRPSLLAMSDEDIDRQPKVDASVAAEIVLGSVPQITHQRSALVERFGAEAGTMVDELPVVARATKQADVELTAAASNADLGRMESDLRDDLPWARAGLHQLHRVGLELRRKRPPRTPIGLLFHRTLLAHHHAIRGIRQPG
jgi:hypothetical protein